MMFEQKIKLVILISIGGVVAGGLLIFFVTSKLSSRSEVDGTNSLSQEEHSTVRDEKCKAMWAEFQAALEKDGMEEARIKEMHEEGLRECPQVFPKIESENSPTTSGPQDVINKTKEENHTPKPNNDFKTKVLNAIKDKKAAAALESLPLASTPPTSKTLLPNAPSTSGTTTTSGEDSLVSGLKTTSSTTVGSQTSIISSTLTPTGPIDGSSSQSTPAPTSKTQTGIPLTGSPSIPTGIPSSETSTITSGTGTLPTTTSPLAIVKAPTVIKDERIAAIKECDSEFKKFLLSGTHTGSSLTSNYGYVKDHFDRVTMFMNNKTLPKDYRWNDYVADFLKGEIIKDFKNKNVSEAQKFYDLYLGAFNSTGVEFTEDRCPMPKRTLLVNDLNDYKFWTAIASEDWTTAEKLLNSSLLLPANVIDGLKKTPKKLQIFKDLNEQQMNALWDYHRMDSDRKKHLQAYTIQNGYDVKMQEDAAAYQQAVEQMQALVPDINLQFDFVIPPLPVKKSIIQEVEDLCKTMAKAAGFDAALAALVSDKSRSLKLILDVVFNLTNDSDRIAVLQKFKKMKSDMLHFVDKHSNKLDLMLLNIASAGINKNIDELDKNAKIALDVAFNYEQKYDSVKIFFECFASKVIDPDISLAISFWDAFAAYLQEFKKIPKAEIESTIHNVSPYDIDSCGKMNATVLKTCIKRVEHKAAEHRAAAATDKHIYDAWEEYAHCYEEIYKAMKGKDMFYLWMGTEDERKPYFLSVSPDVVAALIKSRDALNSVWKFDTDVRSSIIHLVNEKLIERLREQKSNLKLSNDLQNLNSSGSLLENIYVKAENLESCLNMAAINILINFFGKKLYIEYKSEKPASEPTIEELTNLYKKAKENIITNSVAFQKAADMHLVKLQNNIFATSPKL